jgi:hypothetical protein
MHNQYQNNHENPHMEIAMQQMVEAHADMTRIMTHDMVNHDSKNLPLGVQQLLDDHSQIVQMMS